MHKLTPTAIAVSDFYSDGEDARHYTFRLREAGAMAGGRYGQFFMLAVPGVGEAPFSFTALPDDQGVFRALIRRMGAVTSALFALPTGAVLGARGPFGSAWPIAELARQRVLVVGGGCGLAPLVGLTNQLIAQGQCEVLGLVYGARSAAARVLSPERQRWQTQIPMVEVVDDPAFPGPTGSPVDALPLALSKLARAPNRIIVCGPEAMMCAVADHFTRRGLPAECIWLSVERRMHCAVGLCGHCYLEHQYACKQGPIYRWDALQNLLSDRPRQQALTHHYHC